MSPDSRKLFFRVFINTKYYNLTSNSNTHYKACKTKLEDAEVISFKHISTYFPGAQYLGRFEVRGRRKKLFFGFILGTVNC